MNLLNAVSFFLEPPEDLAKMHGGLRFRLDELDGAYFFSPVFLFPL